MNIYIQIYIYIYIYMCIYISYKVATMEKSAFLKSTFDFLLCLFITLD